VFHERAMTRNSNPFSLFGALARYAQGMANYAAIALGFLVCASVASATDLTIHLPDDPSVSRQSVEYQCDASGTSIGLGSGPFSVEYINAGTNSLVVVPISGNALIFSNVISGSGARYTAQHYTWWEAKGSVTLSSDSLTGKIQSSCHRVNRK
jgi:membrane-bound inhibitor of C-type lysozyme